MVKKKYFYWKDDDMWLGYLDEFPDYWTQGDTEEELKEMIGHVPGGKNAVIFTLAVMPEFQGRGISRQLMEEFIKRSSESGKDKILLICRDGLVDYYRKYNFEYIGKSASTHADIEWHEMILSLK